MQPRTQLYLLVVLDLVLQDDAVGLVGLLPQQGDAVLACALVADRHHLGRGWGRKDRAWARQQGARSLCMSLEMV